MKYDKKFFLNYVFMVTTEMTNRKIKFNKKLYDEIIKFCDCNDLINKNIYAEHNARYLKQCYYNLQEKYDMGIIDSKDWNKIISLIEEE